LSSGRARYKWGGTWAENIEIKSRTIRPKFSMFGAATGNWVASGFTTRQ
jgi:hypothetical protein